MHTENFNQNVQNREKVLDLIRGFSVFLMVCSHLIFYVYDGYNPVFSTIWWYGNIVCFTMFLFVSASVSYLAYINIDDEVWKKKKNKFLGRTLQIYSVYLVLSLASVIKNFGGVGIKEVIWRYFLATTFISPPEYTEFIIPFIIYWLVIYFFRKELKSIFDIKLLPTTLAIGVYILGFFLYQIDWGYYLTPLKTLLVGTSGDHKFPIFQYFPVFVAGIHIGRAHSKDKDQVSKIFKQMLLGLIPFLLAFVLIPGLKGFPYNNDFGRYPPTISFLLIGVTTTFLLLNVLDYFPNFIHRVLHFCGSKAFLILIIQGFILGVFKIVFHFTTNSLMLMMCILVLTWYLIFEGIRMFEKLKT